MAENKKNSQRENLCQSYKLDFKNYYLEFQMKWKLNFERFYFIKNKSPQLLSIILNILSSKSLKKWKDIKYLRI